MGQPHWPVDPHQSQFQDLPQQVSTKNIEVPSPSITEGWHLGKFSIYVTSLQLRGNHHCYLKYHTSSVGRVLYQRVRAFWHPALQSRYQIRYHIVIKCHQMLSNITYHQRGESSARGSKQSDTKLSSAGRSTALGCIQQWWRMA